MDHFIPTTVYPSEPLPKALWMFRVAKRGLDLSKIAKDSFIGFCIHNSYPVNPEQTLIEITSQAHDNPSIMEKILGPENFKLIF